MKEEIQKHLAYPEQLEKLYRSNKTSFKREFDRLYPGLEKTPVVEVWHTRLQYDKEEIAWGSTRELTVVLLLSAMAALIAKVPEIAGVEVVFFVSRNIGFVVFPALTAYFAWKYNAGSTVVLTATALTLLAVVYINFLPVNPASDTLLLACIHLPLLLWSLMGWVFVGGNLGDYARRLEFLKCNGDQVVMTGLILIAGGIMSAITVGLFRLIGLQIEEFYFMYFGISGAAAAPVVATYLVRVNPHLVGRVSPVIAKVFTPLVLGMLSVYLAAVVYTGKDPYNDREFLLIFNVLLVGVMAIILFAVAETSQSSRGRIGLYMLFALSVVTILVNAIALSAILFRIAEWGLTPNRLAVLGSNLLILAHLVLVTFRLFQSIRSTDDLARVQHSIALFLPVYSLWGAFVVLGFPLIFGFR